MGSSDSWESASSHDSRASRSGVVTLWFVSAADPSSVLADEPGYDRGFGRKFLALYDSRLPVAPIGDFPLNRSAEVGPGEFYIGGFDGLAVVQTVVEDISRLSQLPMRLREGIAATDIYAVSADSSTGFGAFAHWRAGELKRAFSATPVRILEDEGLPAGCEGAYWAGQHRPESVKNRPATAGVGLPFIPAELAHAVIGSWLGFDPYESAPDIPVSAFAIDGRRVSPTLTSPQPATATSSTSSVASGSVNALGNTRISGHVSAGDTSGEEASGFDGSYDDYEDHENATPDNVREKLESIADASRQKATYLGKKSVSLLQRIRQRFRKN